MILTVFLIVAMVLLAPNVRKDTILMTQLVFVPPANLRSKTALLAISYQIFLFQLFGVFDVRLDYIQIPLLHILHAALVTILFLVVILVSILMVLIQQWNVLSARLVCFWTRILLVVWHVYLSLITVKLVSILTILGLLCNVRLVRMVTT